MSKKDEALKLALTAMKGVWAVGLTVGNAHSFEAAMKGVEEALAEQPAKCKHNVFAPYRCTQCEAEQPASNVNATGGPKAFFSLAEQPAQQQEPVGEVSGYYERGFTENKTLYGKLHNQDLPMGTKLYTSPQPSKPWQGLTAQDRYQAIRPLYNSDENAWLAVEHSNDEYEAIEAKLREKNQ